MPVVLATHEYSHRKGRAIAGHEMRQAKEYWVGTENGPGRYRVVASVSHGSSSAPLFCHHNTQALTDRNRRVDFFYPHGSTVGLQVYAPAHLDETPLNSFPKFVHRYDSPDGMHEALHDLKSRLEGGAWVRDVAGKVHDVARLRLSVLTRNPESSAALAGLPPGRLSDVVEQSVVHGFLLADQVRMLKAAESSSPYPGVRNPTGAIESVARSLLEIVPDAQRHPALLRAAASTMGLSWDDHRALFGQLHKAAEGKADAALVSQYYRP